MKASLRGGPVQFFGGVHQPLMKLFQWRHSRRKTSGQVSWQLKTQRRRSTTLYLGEQPTLSAVSVFGKHGRTRRGTVSVWQLDGDDSFGQKSAEMTNLNLTYIFPESSTVNIRIFQGIMLFPALRESHGSEISSRETSRFLMFCNQAHLIGTLFILITYLHAPT